MMASLTWAGSLQGVGFLTRREPGTGVGEGQSGERWGRQPSILPIYKPPAWDLHAHLRGLQTSGKHLEKQKRLGRCGHPFRPTLQIPVLWCGAALGFTQKELRAPPGC